MFDALQTAIVSKLWYKNADVAPTDHGVAGAEVKKKKKKKKKDNHAAAIGNRDPTIVVSGTDGSMHSKDVSGVRIGPRR